MKHRELSIALGAHQLFWVFVSGLVLFLGSAIENGPYRGDSARAAVLGFQGLLIATAVLYSVFHLGFVFFARRCGLPLLAWSSAAVTLAPTLVGTVPFRALSILVIFFGASLLAARRRLGDAAFWAGVLELGSGLLGLLFGPTPYVFMFIPAWVFKTRLLRALRDSESPQPCAADANVRDSELVAWSRRARARREGGELTHGHR